MCAIPRGRKAESLRNRREMVGTGPDSWRTNTMGLGGGRSATIPSIFLGAVSLPNRGSEAQARKELTTKPSAGANGPLPICNQLLNLTFYLYESI